MNGKVKLLIGAVGLATVATGIYLGKKTLPELSNYKRTTIPSALNTDSIFSCPHSDEQSLGWPLLEDRPESITFVKAKNMKQAKQYAAKNLRIYNFDLGNDLELANYVNEGLTNIYNKYKGKTPMPQNIALDLNDKAEAYYDDKTDTLLFNSEGLSRLVTKKRVSDNIERIKKHPDAYGAILTKLDEFTKNPNAFDRFDCLDLYDMIVDIECLNHRKKFYPNDTYMEPGLTSGSKFGLVYHEYGHVLYYKIIGDSKRLKSLVADMEKSGTNNIRCKVSCYASKNLHEFIAETFRALMNGKKVPKDVMELYKKYNGPQMP
ncbi:MAG: hypothetical protein LBJ74_06130 [Heliobacteriaceae bacterium]|jgi:hypothetical protein|nr:hypothetical protein [Heliobacteriaceae bacterium]